MSEMVSQKNLTEKSSYSLTANMFMAFIITFAAGTLSFESYMPEKFTAVYIVAVTVLCFVTWMVLSFISGRNKKWQFTVYSSLFWILPNVIIYLANDGPEFCRKSITMYLLSEFSAIVAIPQLKAAGGLINVKLIPFTIIIVLLCIFSYLGGYITTDDEEDTIEYD